MSGGVQAGHGGNFKIAGTTLLSGVPTSKRVFLYPENTPTLCIASTMSGSGGAFVFNNLAPGKYFVIGLDPNSGGTDGAIHTWITAIPM